MPQPAAVPPFSIGKQRLGPEAFHRQIAPSRDSVTEVVCGARDDSPTFAAERYAHRLHKASDEQKRAPRLAIQQAVVQAARVPLANLPAAFGPSRRPGTDLSRQGGG